MTAPDYTGHVDAQGDPSTRDLPDITVTKLSVGPMDNNAYLLVCKHTGEGVLIDAIHAARTTCVGIVINPGGLTHTSVVLRDALSGVALPVAEVHISDVYAREAFRHHSYVHDVAIVHVIGEGVSGYATATLALLDAIEQAETD